VISEAELIEIERRASVLDRLTDDVIVAAGMALVHGEDYRDAVADLERRTEQLAADVEA
jgi:chaperonin cofactor prefoldin